MGCVSAISCLFFIVSGIQYWISDYMITVLGASKHVVFIYFSATAITAPIFGAIAGSVITSKLGGYESKLTMRSCIFAALICAMFAVFVPSQDDFQWIVFMVWVILFCGGYILPAMQGIMMMQVDNDQKSMASSFANFSYNFFGYMPAPVVYGAVCSLDIGDKSRWGMVVLMWMTVPAFLCLLPVLYVTTRPEKVRSSKISTEPLL